MSSFPDSSGIYQTLIIEGGIRLFLGLLFLYTETLEPFHRKIQPEELWLYKNPRTDSYIPTSFLWPIVFLIPVITISGFYVARKDKVDAIQALLAVTLALGLNGVLTNIIKLVVGRPRPDFFWRCFPDGQSNPSMICTGDKAEITNGMKSFPSGHSSFAFAGLGFTSFFLMGKMQIFTSRGRGQSGLLLLCVAPLLFALTIALSRTCDYHHHWQDVLVGSLVGLSVSWLCYRQYYPSLVHPSSYMPYALLREGSTLEDLKRVDSLQEKSVTKPSSKFEISGVNEALSTQ